LQSRPIPGTEDGVAPFFSPDGASIAFQVGDVMKRTRLDGGTPVVIATTSSFFFGGAWGPDNTIVYAAWGTGLSRVNANGRTQPQRIPIRDSTTEGDCLTLTAASQLPPRRREYAAQLVRVWQRAVYGQEQVQSATVYGLCNDFAPALDSAYSRDPAPGSAR